MSKGKYWRLGGFAAALAASAGLIAAASGATGAYFTDTHPGSFSANSGHLKVNITNVSGGATASGPDNLVLNFQDLYPTDYRTVKINYATDSSIGNEDLWLVFPGASAPVGSVQNNVFDMFTGPKTSYAGGGLGRYGHFAVADSHSGTDFSSYNLSSGYSDDCTPDANGHAIAPMGTAADNSKAQPCAVPAMIKLASNLTNGATGTVSLTFGLTQRQTQQNQAEFAGLGVDFQIVATQPGVKP